MDFFDHPHRPGRPLIARNHQPDGPLLVIQRFSAAAVRNDHPRVSHSRVKFPQAENYLIPVARLHQQIRSKGVAPQLFSERKPGLSQNIRQRHPLVGSLAPPISVIVTVWCGILASSSVESVNGDATSPSTVSFPEGPGVVCAASAAEHSNTIHTRMIVQYTRRCPAAPLLVGRRKERLNRRIHDPQIQIRRRERHRSRQARKE